MTLKLSILSSELHNFDSNYVKTDSKGELEWKIGRGNCYCFLDFGMVYDGVSNAKLHELKITIPITFDIKIDEVVVFKGCAYGEFIINNFNDILEENLPHTIITDYTPSRISVLSELDFEGVSSEYDVIDYNIVFICGKNNTNAKFYVDEKFSDKNTNYYLGMIEKKDFINIIVTNILNYLHNYSVVDNILRSLLYGMRYERHKWDYWVKNVITVGKSSSFNYVFKLNDASAIERYPSYMYTYEISGKNINRSNKNLPLYHIEPDYNFVITPRLLPIDTMGIRDRINTRKNPIQLIQKNLFVTVTALSSIMTLKDDYIMEFRPYFKSIFEIPKRTFIQNVDSQLSTSSGYKNTELKFTILDMETFDNFCKNVNTYYNNDKSLSTSVTHLIQSDMKIMELFYWIILKGDSNKIECEYTIATKVIDAIMENRLFLFGEKEIIDCLFKYFTTVTNNRLDLF